MPRHVSHFLWIQIQKWSLSTKKGRLCKISTMRSIQRCNYRALCEMWKWCRARFTGVMGSAFSTMMSKEVELGKMFFSLYILPFNTFFWLHLMNKCSQNRKQCEYFNYNKKKTDKKKPRQPNETLNIHSCATVVILSCRKHHVQI